MKLLVATSNAGKLVEIREIVAGVRLELVSLRDLRLCLGPIDLGVTGTVENPVGPLARHHPLDRRSVFDGQIRVAQRYQLYRGRGRTLDGGAQHSSRTDNHNPHVQRSASLNTRSHHPRCDKYHSTVAANPSAKS